MMASPDIRYNCGCGFRAKVLEAAAKHCDEKSHVITVQGNIYPDKAPIPSAVPPTRTRKTATPAAEVVEETGPITNFAALKSRISRTKS